MNVGIVTTWFERGAAYVSKAYEQTLEKDFNVFIYARGGEQYGKGDPEWDRPNVTFSPRWNSIFFREHRAMSRWHFYKWLKKNNISIVLFNEQHDISIVAQFSKYGIKTGAYIDYYTEKTVSEFDYYDFVICNTKRHYSVFKDHKNCLFMQWGTDLETFKPVNSAKEVVSPVKFFHSAGFGGVNLRKGTDILVMAFQQVKGDAKLIIHSQAPIEKYGSDIKKIIERDGRIEFIHSTVTAPGLYHLGDVYVYPSRLEGIGLSVPEALSVGLPVVTTDSPPMNEFVENEHNGFLVKISHTKKRKDGYFWPETTVDKIDLAIKMQQYVDSPGLAQEQGKVARETAIEKFDWKRNSKPLIEFVRNFENMCHFNKISRLSSIKMTIQDFCRYFCFCIHRVLEKSGVYYLLKKNKIFCRFK